MSSKKATKIDKIFTVDLTLCSKWQIDGEDFVNFRGLLRKYELYKYILTFNFCQGNFMRHAFFYSGKNSHKNCYQSRN